MKKQTAVEWLGYELNTKLFYNITPELWEQVNAIFEQAKAMEKEQIMEAYKHNSMIRTVSKAEQYFNETYGGDK
jgi:hypothetical protein